MSNNDPQQPKVSCNEKPQWAKQKATMRQNEQHGSIRGHNDPLLVTMSPNESYTAKMSQGESRWTRMRLNELQWAAKIHNELNLTQ